MTSRVRAALGLGSNLGDRRATLDRVVERLRSTPDVWVVAVSSFVESDPVGGPEQPVYLNAVVIIDTTLTPDELLAMAHDCEDEARRVRGVRWGPRTLDVDLLAYDELVVSSANLTLPHPRATERAFVLVPWAEVEPDREVAGRRVAEWAAAVDASGVRDGSEATR
jgi:2-amino-4-hydroxy-6-hydroxymethyldihydropteridine diphosphokinase